MSRPQGAARRARLRGHQDDPQQWQRRRLRPSDSAAKAETRVSKAIASTLGLKIEVMARTHEELAAVVKADPLGKVADEPVALRGRASCARPRRRTPSTPSTPRPTPPSAGSSSGANCSSGTRNGQAKTKLVGGLLGEAAQDGRHRPQLEHRPQAARPDRAVPTTPSASQHGGNLLDGKNGAHPTQRYLSRKSRITVAACSSAAPE